MSVITTRLATAADAEAAVEVVRQSIIRLCEADHQHDAPTLERWLVNKTPKHFNDWLANPENRLIVAELDSALAGVAALHSSGEIRLCYVHPGYIRMGVGHALLLAVEAEARHFQLETLNLKSSLTARRFYERFGFSRAGDSTPHFGVLRGYPYTKTLTTRACGREPDVDRE